MTSNVDPGRLERSLDYLAWYYAIGAVLRVFRENEERHRIGKSSIKPNADVWCIIDDLRRDIHRRTRQAWCAMTDEDSTYFPLSVDAVARLYFRLRKRSGRELDEFDREIRDAMPARTCDSPSLFDLENHQ